MKEYATYVLAVALVIVAAAIGYTGHKVYELKSIVDRTAVIVDKLPPLIAKGEKALDKLDNSVLNETKKNARDIAKELVTGAREGLAR